MKLGIKSSLQKYIVDQNYKKYTFEDQAIWRYIMRQIKNNLSLYGYKGSLSGMEKTGITFNQIPRIEDIDQKLQKYNWRAVPVSGFIPPLAFMEFQLNQILPVASELRTLNHINYTPAPDIVHEAVGHIPFLVEPIFSQFLRSYAQTVKKAIFNKEDVVQYEAIRNLSDIKEKPQSTQSEIKKAEEYLKQVNENKKYTSESSALSRFIWWTSEYGLMKEGLDVKIYGAGLISSPGEAKHSWSKDVKKIPLSEECLNYPYDITKFQPQLFVAKNFEHLLDVLNTINQALSWKQGGLSSVQKAIQSETLNTLEFDSGLQISGVLESQKSENKTLHFLKFKGPCQLSFESKELPLHGKEIHAEGYSTPLGLLRNFSKPLHEWTESDLNSQKIRKGQAVHLKFQSGIELKGEFIRELRKNGKLLALTFKKAHVYRESEVFFEPSWGEFDLGIGQFVTSVFSGLADKDAYGELDDGFQPSQVATKSYSQKQKNMFKVYEEISKLGQLEEPDRKQKIQSILKTLRSSSDSLWLGSLELLERSKNFPDIKNQIILHLENIESKNSSFKSYIKEGMAFYS